MKHELAQLEAKLAADSQETRDAVHALLYCEVTHVARAFIASLDYLDLQSRVLPLSEEERTPQLLKFINERMMEFV
jgi:hypothetical protein